jgi:pantoate kinase
MNTFAAYTPGHITGIFYIDDLAENPLQRGSLGAGFCIDLGVTTRVRILEKKPGDPVFSVGGLVSDELRVSKTLYTHFIESLPDAPAYRLRIDHLIEPPQASGFGTSGAGALSLSYALNSCFGRPLKDEEAAGLAHITEIECRTGLGTVIGEFHGGFELRTKPGAPGIGKIQKIPCPPDTFAVFAVRGPHSTSSALSDQNIRENVNKAGKSALVALGKNPSMTNFQELSHQFALDTGLCTPWVQELLHLLEKKGIVGSMLMFGEAVFTLVNREKVGEVEKTFEDFEHGKPGKKIRIFSSQINRSGGKYL